MNDWRASEDPDLITRASARSFSPLAMPAQNLARHPMTAQRLKPAATRRSTGSTLILALVLLATFIATAIFVRGLWGALSLQNGGSLAHYLFLANASVLFAWIAFAGANATAGAIAIVAGRGRDTIKLPASGEPITTRNALLFPIYHEDPNEIAQRIAELDAQLRARGNEKHFDVFVLSDSRSEEARAQERDVFARLVTERGVALPVLYRNRDQNIGKKAGNIADWVTRHGGRYSHFVIFDADSRITGSLLARLVAAMERSHDSGIIQTVPRLANPRTVFAALNAFAHNIYGPAFAAGFASWQGASGNYWGHNAIIRTRAFAQAAGLPELPGKAPFGGHIQSHDFVEAALIRRAGWRVDLVTSPKGSSEEGPTTVVDMAVRDRRWMQGNLQHLRVLTARGLAPISRMHMAFGILGYLSSALWASMLVLGTWLSWQEQTRVTSYFTDTKTLFPSWPTFDPEAGLAVLSGTAAVLFLPKISGLLAHLWTTRATALETVATVAAAIGETLLSMLIAPVMMLIHLRGLFDILAGHDSGWAAQVRDARQITLAQSARFHLAHVVIGLLLAVVSLLISVEIAAWMLPVTLGLVASPIVTWATARRWRPVTRRRAALRAHRMRPA
ncbi:glucans biosynthesis glucosyltransferase MdoH [Tepidamorphus sp. 3E244]|uniref:glucans biosynthesis glucosyltransferase MdoH n=1 Tax=Tepidamorphus sp. 3E244 TaxID=3385498 RepID=UPI0038FCC5B7